MFVIGALASQDVFMLMLSVKFRAVIVPDVKSNFGLKMAL